MDVSVQDLVKEIRESVKQHSSSQKDELRVMRAMLNDPTYKVGIYDKDGKVDEYSPFEDSRKMVGSIIQATTKISNAEATALANDYEFTKSDSATMVNLSKEFVNTYLTTDRKLPLGGREKMSASLLLKHNENEMVKPCPRKIQDKDGNTAIVNSFTTIPPHDSVRASSPCPPWLSKSNN